MHLWDDKLHACLDISIAKQQRLANQKICKVINTIHHLCADSQNKDVYTSALSILEFLPMSNVLVLNASGV